MPDPAEPHAPATGPGGERAEPSHDRRDDRHHPVPPWWWGLGPVGAAVVFLVGIAAVVWSFLGMPGASDNHAADYHQAARVIAIALVVAGTTALTRFRSRTTDPAPDAA